MEHHCCQGTIQGSKMNNDTNHTINSTCIHKLLKIQTSVGVFVPVKQVYTQTSLDRVSTCVEGIDIFFMHLAREWIYILLASPSESWKGFRVSMFWEKLLGFTQTSGTRKYRTLNSSRTKTHDKRQGQWQWFRLSRAIGHANTMRCRRSGRLIRQTGKHPNSSC